MKKANSTMKMLQPWHSRHLSYHSTSSFEDLTDDEDQGPIMCLMAKNMNVKYPNSSDDELDEKDEVANLIN